MTLYRRENSRIWQVDITLPSGKRFRGTSKTENKQLAQAYHDKVKAEMWKEEQLGIKRGHTFDEAVDLFLDEKRHCKSLESYEQHCAWWMKHLKGSAVSAITQELILSTIRKKEAEGVSPATCNRHLATLRAILRLACLKYRWIEQVPTFFMAREPKGRTRWLKPDEIQRLLAELPEPRREVAIFSFATGLRQGNVLGLRWSQVDLNRKVVVIDGKDMKAGRDHAIPLPEAAVDVIRRQIGKHDEFVFTTSRGSPMKSFDHAIWRRACERAGISDFRPHDMRHTWATTLVQAGVPDGVLQALGAWETPKMVKRYAHHSADSMRRFTSRVDEVFGGMSQITSHPAEIIPLRRVG